MDLLTYNPSTCQIDSMWRIDIIKWYIDRSRIIDLYVMRKHQSLGKYENHKNLNTKPWLEITPTSTFNEREWIDKTILGQISLLKMMFGMSINQNPTKFTSSNEIWNEYHNSILSLQQHFARISCRKYYIFSLVQTRIHIHEKKRYYQSNAFKSEVVFYRSYKKETLSITFSVSKR